MTKYTQSQLSTGALAEVIVVLGNSSEERTAKGQLSCSIDDIQRSQAVELRYQPSSIRVYFQSHHMVEIMLFKEFH